MYEIAMFILAIGLIYIAVAVYSAIKLRKRNKKYKE